MLRLTIPGGEMWDEDVNEFVYGKEKTLQLEHSLLSLAKWEAKWHKAFISEKEKTQEETIDYIRCMTITPNVDDEVYRRLTPDNIEAVNNYIAEPMTASVVSEFPGSARGGSRDTVTAELIYYWMIAFNIPFECQKWHLNRLLSLIKVCNAKSTSPKKMSRREIAARNAALNDARRKRLKTKG